MIIIPDNRAGELLLLQSTKGLELYTDLKDRIVRIVDLYGDCSGCCPVIDFNRRFGRILRKLGKSISEVIVELEKEGRVILRHVNGRTWVLSTSLNRMSELAADDEMSEIEVNHKMGHQWIDRTLGKID